MNNYKSNTCTSGAMETLSTSQVIALNIRFPVIMRYYNLTDLKNMLAYVYSKHFTCCFVVQEFDHFVHNVCLQ